MGSTDPPPAASAKAGSSGQGSDPEVPNIPGEETLVGLWDHKDLLLLGYYTALIKLFDGANAKQNPSVCSTAEEVLDWLGFVFIMLIYCARHFYKAPRNLWLKKATLCFVFGVFALCMHSQPISCSLARRDGQTISMKPAVEEAQKPSEDLHTLSYVQGALVLTLALIASELCPKWLYPPAQPPKPTKTSGEPASSTELQPLSGATGDHTTPKPAPSSAPATGDGTTVRAAVVGSATPV